MSALKEYFADHVDLVNVYEVRSAHGGIDFMIKIDGGYSDDGAVGMLEYHRKELKRVLKAEGLL